MRALVTNDDGVHSPGLRTLADAARSRGLEVTVVAPSFDASGSSASMTAVASDGRVLVDAVVEGPGGGRMLAVQGPPAFIVRAAMYGAFGPVPDLVLSGVNRGLNTGRAVLHSGTVGAALTAAVYGRSGLAVSAEVPDDDQWEPEVESFAESVAWLLDSPGATVLNVNVPHRGPTGPSGVRATTLSERGTVQGTVTELGGGLVPVTFGHDHQAPAPGTDDEAIAGGYISVSAIRAVTEDARFDLAEVLDHRGGAVRRR